MIETLTPAQARRIALSAQGFGRASTSQVGTRQLRAVASRLQLVQLDSVNVFERSHYLPFLARVGPYDKAHLDRLLLARRGDYIEYWAHEAAVIPVVDWPLFRWRMRHYRDWYAAHPESWVHGNARHVERVRAQLASHGPLAAGQIADDAGRATSGWWEWSDTKRAVEYLFRVGEVVSAGRTRFQRTYALAEHQIPATQLNETISASDAVRRLIEKSTLAHGVGTLRDLADYYRLKQEPARTAVASLVEEGVLLPVRVEGWTQPAWLHHQTRLPRRVEASALLSPFDPMVWERARAQRMFDFHYRIEIYTPAEKRVFGYYSLPVLIDDAIVGRIDLKSDRQARVLRVQSAWREAHAPNDIEERIVPLLEQARAWQGLDSVAFSGRGDLSAALEAAWDSRGNVA